MDDALSAVLVLLSRHLELPPPRDRTRVFIGVHPGRGEWGGGGKHARQDDNFADAIL